MLSVSEIERLLKDRRLDIVARETGLSSGTIRRFRDGEVTDPQLSTVLVLSEYLQSTAPVSEKPAVR